MSSEPTHECTTEGCDGSGLDCADNGSATAPLRLVELAVAPNHGVVAALRALLAKAEAGEVQAVALSGLLADGKVLTNWIAGGGEVLQLGCATYHLADNIRRHALD